jgi:tripartite ATP-independent transporter DctM subunit
MLSLVAVTFVLTILIGIPVSFALGLTAVVGFITSGLPMTKMVIRTLTSIDTFPLLAGPFFILAGEIISRGNIMDHIIRFAESLVGHIRGGLAYTNVLDSMFFAGISGSAVADVAAMGKIEIDMMVEGGYEKDFSVALTIASSCCGPIIPPSVIMVIYALASSVSVGALFVAGIIPGILMGLSMMAVCYYYARIRNYRAVTDSFSLKRVFTVGKRVFWYLLLPFIVMGGIIGGVFTATEAGCVGAVYSIILTLVTRAISLKSLFQGFVRAGIVTSVVIIIISMASALAWFLAVEQVPQMMLIVLEPLIDSPYIFLFALNIMFLIIGCVLEPGAAIIILVPVLLPTFLKMGLNELQMGMIMVFNLTIGLITPPVGICIYVGSTIGEIPVERAVKATLPFIFALIVVLFLITYIPEISLFLPRLFGFI